MFSEQRIFGLLVPADIERRSPERLLVMTRLAILARKLSTVRIGRVAIAAHLMRDRLFEVRRFMARVTRRFVVGAMQRKRRLIVIKSRCGANLFPARCRMTRLASCRECSMMRILVAALARIERNVFVLDYDLRIHRSRAMARVAGNLLMQAGERISGVLVVESGGRFPGIQRMTAPAVRAQLRPMDVLVTSGAGRSGKSQIGVIQVFHLNAGALALQNMGGAMASIAGESGMFARQRITRLAMIELGR